MAGMKFRTRKFSSDQIPSVTLSEDRWDNLDPFENQSDIFKEYLDDLSTVEREIEEREQMVKAAKAARTDLRKMVSGRLSIEVGEIDEATRLANMDASERKGAVDRQYRALTLACNALGEDIPPIQMDMDEMWHRDIDVPVADNGVSTEKSPH